MSKFPLAATLLVAVLSWCAVSCQGPSIGQGPSASATPASPAMQTTVASATPGGSARTYSFFALVALLEVSLLGLCVYMMRGPSLEMPVS